MNECEHVIVLDVCCTIKRPTTDVFWQKTKQNKKVLTPAQIKPKSLESKRYSIFLLHADASNIYLRASTQCYSHNLSTETFRKFYGRQVSKHSA